jgi:hydroxymethylbilane synthase
VSGASPFARPHATERDGAVRSGRLFRVGTRGSRLALVQTGWLVDQLRRAAPGTEWELVEITTEGDRSASAIRGDGAFVKEIQRALAEGRIDLAVHSLKDLPTEPVGGLVVAAIPERADPRDALVGTRLGSLAPGARVGTGSPRRSAQVRRLRPDVEVVFLRGNVPTRVAKVRDGQLDAAILAAAGLARLGFEPDQVFEPGEILPAPGQGALAVEVRVTDEDVAGTVSAVDDPATRAAVVAERAVLRELGGGCMLPVATLGAVGGDGTLVVQASVTSADGTQQAGASGRGDPARALEIGAALGRRLVELGALDLLEDGGPGGSGD